jgi:hypothetical protein
MPLLVIGNLLGQLRHKVWPLRAWANKVHVATDDVPKLRDFVNANLSDETTDARGSIIVLTGPNWSSFLCVGPHRAKFHYSKRTAVFPDTFLFVQNRPR